MIKIDNIAVFNFEGALRGMRNPMNSWEKRDSYYKYENIYNGVEEYIIGPNDLDLAQKLISGGPVHSKFMRQIFVSIDIDAPLYWWKEMDQYRIGCTTNSCSTMHKIHSKGFTLDDFSHEHLLEHTKNWFIQIIITLNEYREKFLKTKDKKYWWQMIQLLPSSYNQKRTWTADYETLRNIYQWRRNHKLDEWHDFCHMIEELPYGEELICYNIGGNENEA